jgi:hypothetical protein
VVISASSGTKVTARPTAVCLRKVYEQAPMAGSKSTVVPAWPTAAIWTRNGLFVGMVLFGRGSALRPARCPGRRGGRFDAALRSRTQQNNPQRASSRRSSSARQMSLKQKARQTLAVIW